MAIQWRRRDQLYTSVNLGDAIHDCGEVALQVYPQRQEIGNDDDAADTSRGKKGHGALQIGPAELQEGGLDLVETARLRQFCRYRPHCLVGRFDARAVGKNHDPGAHVLPWIYALM